MEINTASYEELLRIPGIGLTYAKKIMKARKYYKLTHDILGKIGVSLKRSRYFITCDGKYTGGNLIDDPKILYDTFAAESETPQQMKLPVN